MQIAAYWYVPVPLTPPPQTQWQLSVLSAAAVQLLAPGLGPLCAALGLGVYTQDRQGYLGVRGAERG